MKRIYLVVFIALITMAGCKKDKKETPSPVISSISPANGVWSTIITIRGNNFSANITGNEVKFNGKTATVLSAGIDQLTAEVPKGAGTGPVEVKVNGRVVTGPEFSYTYITSVTTLAGSTGGFADGNGVLAQFNNPIGVCADGQGNIYVADVTNYKIRKVTPSGMVSTFAGSTFGFADGTGSAAQFKSPWAICIDAQSNLYIADVHNFKIRKITSAGVVSTVAGSTQGDADGSATTAQFNTIVGICVDAQGNLYVTDEGNHDIRKVTPSGVVTTVAGSTSGYADGSRESARFNSPRGICIDPQGNLYVADAANARIRKITPAGVVTTLAGSTTGYADGSGPAAQFSAVCGMAIDSKGDLYVAEFTNNKIRRITPAGVVSTLAGSTLGYRDGDPFTAQFYNPYGVAADAQGNFYVADRNNNKIRKIIVE